LDEFIHFSQSAKIRLFAETIVRYYGPALFPRKLTDVPREEFPNKVEKEPEP
jgi:hypothetical protein